MRKGRVRLMDRPFQKVCLQIGGKQMQELETQFGMKQRSYMKPVIEPLFGSFAYGVLATSRTRSFS